MAAPSKAALAERKAVAAWLRGLAVLPRASGEERIIRLALLASLARRIEDGEHLTESGLTTARSGVEKGWEAFA